MEKGIYHIKQFWKPALIIAVLVSLFFPLESSAGSIISITRSAFCKDIKHLEPVNLLEGRGRIENGKALFFWMEFQGGEDAFDLLMEKGHLPVSHIWRSGIIVIDKIPVGITPEKWLEHRESIKRHFKKHGFFTYRTFSFKEYFDSDHYEIVILDAYGKGVPRVGGTKAYRPSIRVHR